MPKKRKYNYLIYNRGKPLAKARRKYTQEPPKMHKYDGIEYFLVGRIHKNMWLYESRKGIKICFDDFEICVKEIL